MGMQFIEDLTLIRHAYVYSPGQQRGIGAAQLSHLAGVARDPMRIGAGADARWAVGFYWKHGFELVPPAEKEKLRRR